MASYTRYLTVVAKSAADFRVRLLEENPRDICQQAVECSAELRYSPVMAAYLKPAAGPPALPKTLTSTAFFFSPTPYKALGSLKPHLTQPELAAAYFTEGLASLLVLNAEPARARELREIVGDCAFEYWPIHNETLSSQEILSESRAAAADDTFVLPAGSDPELNVYIEQISASLGTLWASYGIYFPEERSALRKLGGVADRLIEQHAKVRQGSGGLNEQIQANAIVSALVELSAALSYAVTQGASGATPILSNRSPFPHHSLLGIGGSVRALTKYTRYLEDAFIIRSAGDVIKTRYSELKYPIPASVAKYTSGESYKLPKSGEEATERFDGGGDFPQRNQIPLIAHFSLRHGFMESKFSVTAASESLTAETEPQWTLVTLSHEVMHSRVRSIFNALFGSTWQENGGEIIQQKHFEAFTTWLETRNQPTNEPVIDGLRNAILIFCYAIDRFAAGPSAPESNEAPPLTIDELRTCYARNKQLAVEAAVHFHDYYFAYAYQPKMYMMSIWASWIKVAAPFTRTLEYLVRSLATVACGTGLEPRAAFDFAIEQLQDGLDALEAAGIRSPLFAELRRLTTSGDQVESTRSLFKLLYYLMDQLRLFFASPAIAARIDRIEEDPFAEGSAVAENYSANIFVFGEEGAGRVSPIRYSLAALFTSLSQKAPIDDPQWLTAWNYMVISS